MTPKQTDTARKVSVRATDHMDVILPADGVRGETANVVPRAERSRIPGVGGVLVAEVNSPHGKKHRLTFDRELNVFVIQLLDDTSKHIIIYRIDELLCVRDSPVKLKRGVPVLDEKKVNISQDTLYFYFVYKKDSYRWRLREVPIVYCNMAERNYWRDTIDTTLLGISSRPANIMVFINPFGGKGKAEKIFETNVEPFFRLSKRLNYEVFLTQRANHARDTIIEMDYKKWMELDGIVSVGGDGLFNELLSGALLRTQRDADVNIDNPDTARLVTPHLRFGIIGAGSANSIVSTVHETDDYPTAAVHIAIGSECNVDVCTVHQQNKLIRISANAISYGWLGDVLRDSENYRWLGPIRYQWSALRTTIRHPLYRGRVSFTLSHKQLTNPEDNRPSSIENVQPDPDETPKYQFNWHGEFTHVICCVIPTVTPFTPYGLAPFTGIGDGTLDLAMVPRISRCANIQFMRKVAMYGGKGLYDLDHSLNCYRVIKWSYLPDEDQEDPGVWNLDGEILEQPKKDTLHFRLHPQLIMFFGRDAAQIKPTKGSSFIKKRKSSIIYH